MIRIILASWIRWILYLVSGIVILGSCATPYRQISREYGKPPLSTKDTFYLSGRCLSTFPIDTTERTEYIILPAPDDSSEFYRQRSDEILVEKKRLQDSLRDVQVPNCPPGEDVFDQAFEVGYKAGKYDGLKNRVHDTIEIRRTNTVVDPRETARERTRAEIAEKDREHYRDQRDRSRRLVTWLLAFLIALLVIVILMIKKKTSATGIGSSWITSGISFVVGIFRRKNK